MQTIRSFANHQDLPVALTIGNFDGVHLGHQQIIQQLRQQAKARGLISAVMTFSPHPSLFFQPKDNFLIADDDTKLKRLAECGVEKTFMIPFDHAFASIPAPQFIEHLQHELQVRYLLVGDDFRFGQHGQGDFQMLTAAAQSKAFELEQVPTQSFNQQRISSSRIRQFISEANFKAAAALLGYPYGFAGVVEHGQKLGRTLGFPTANVAISSRQLLPQGVFAVEAAVADGRYSGVCNIGVKPTLSGQQRTVEVHLFDCASDLYGQSLHVTPIAKVRDEMKFAALADLKQQIECDVRVAKQICADHQKGPE